MHSNVAANENLPGDLFLIQLQLRIYMTWMTAKWLSILLSITLNLARKGRPKYVIGRVETLNPSIGANCSTSGTGPTRTNFLNFSYIYYHLKTQQNMTWKMKERVAR